MRKKRRLRAHAFGSDEREIFEQEIRKQLKYMVDEGICIIDHIDRDGEPIYRLKTQAEIDQELADILNS